jgi:hypothetical protein
MPAQQQALYVGSNLKTTMQIFKIRQSGFKEIRRTMLIRTIPMLVIVLTFGITVASKSLNYTEILPYYIPFIVVLLAFGIYRGINRQKTLFNSYTLTITNNLISREQVNTPTISIYFNDIKEISKHKNGSFTVKGKDATDIIAIPPQVDNYSQLETTLQGIRPIVAKDNVSFLQKYQSLTALLVVGLMLCVYTVNNKIIVALAGTTFVSIMIWSFIKIRGSKNVDRRTKKIVWWSLIVVASVIAVMIFKLTGLVDTQKH